MNTVEFKEAVSYVKGASVTQQYMEGRHSAQLEQVRDAAILYVKNGREAQGRSQIERLCSLSLHGAAQSIQEWGEAAVEAFQEAALSLLLPTVVQLVPRFPDDPNAAALIVVTQYRSPQTVMKQFKGADLNSVLANMIALVALEQNSTREDKTRQNLAAGKYRKFLL